VDVVSSLTALGSAHAGDLSWRVLQHLSTKARSGVVGRDLCLTQRVHLQF
jgi:hypothetical protein